MGNEPSRFNFANSKLIYQLANSHQFCRGKFADVPNFYHEQLIHCIRYKRLPRHGFVWRRQITFGSNGAEEEWLSQNSTLSSWSTFTAAGTLISLETDWLLWLQQGSITLDPWPLRDGVKKSKWKFKMAFAMKGGGSRGGLECHIPILKNDFFKNHLESFPDCENVFCT